MDFICQTLEAVLEHQAARSPDRDFIVFPDRNLRFSYAVFAARAETLARGLRAIGIGPGDHLGIWATNVPDWLTFLFAASKIGAVTVTINTSYRTHELEYLVRQSDIKALCLIDGYRDSDYVAMVNELIPELQACERGQLASARFPRLRSVIFMGPEKHRGMYTTPELLLLGSHTDGEEVRRIGAGLDYRGVINMQYTSGTTGFPKGVMLTHHNILNNGWAIGERQKFTDAERVCLPVPLFHCFGLVLGVMAIITHGATAAAVTPDGWLHSGDLGTMDANGYFRITGRIKDMIIRGGENVYPREIEEFLLSTQGVKDVQVAGIASPKYGEEVGAFVILKDGACVKEEDVRDFCRGRISRFKVPRYVFFVNSFPMTASGKIQKYKLKELGLSLLKERAVVAV